MGRRQVIEVPGLGHSAQPIPLAVKLGQFLYTGSINGTDPATGKTPEDAPSQMAYAFANVKRVVEAAGGTLNDIVKMDARLSDMSLRDGLNAEWARMFPNEQDRPVRHTVQASMGGNQLVQLEIVAIIG